MATSITPTSSVASPANIAYKAFDLNSDGNVLPCLDPHIASIHLDGSQFGRNFTPTQVTISYGKGTQVKAFNVTGAKATWGSVTYIDGSTIPANLSQYKYARNAQPIANMPSWLSSLVTPNI